MNILIEQIERAFSSSSVPSEAELVQFDGVDDPGKTYLREQLLGKSQEDVLRLLCSGELGNGSMCTEELELAELIGLRYYLQPFLVHIAHRVCSDTRALDDETPFFLFAHIKNILEHRGKQAFTDSQLSALSALVTELQRLLATQTNGIWITDVSKQLNEVSNALNAS